ncbi:hypothetical protein XH87_00060 [Bradyrhizobium sp. CCBAU 53415]|nr:hypothetical protein [Bradyrhizobium sp. CCBAU 53415]
MDSFDTRSKKHIRYGPTGIATNEGFIGNEYRAFFDVSRSQAVLVSNTTLALAIWADESSLRDLCLDDFTSFGVNPACYER